MRVCVRARARVCVWLCEGVSRVGTVLMDPSDEALQALLVDQAYRHVVMVPHFEGIAVDRLDYTGMFSMGTVCVYVYVCVTDVCMRRVCVMCACVCVCVCVCVCGVCDVCVASSADMCVEFEGWVDLGGHEVPRIACLISV